MNVVSATAWSSLTCKQAPFILNLEIVAELQVGADSPFGLLYTAQSPRLTLRSGPMVRSYSLKTFKEAEGHETSVYKSQRIA